MTSDLTNPALADLGFLVGTWDMTLSRASFLPDPAATVTGLVEFAVIESGGLLAMRQMTEPSGPPAASWVFGRDASGPQYTALYSDGRGVSRVYGMDLGGDTWRMWRHDPEFSQRFEATVHSDRNTVTGRWDKRAADGPWEHDFDLTYRRRDASG